MNPDHYRDQPFKNLFRSSWKITGYFMDLNGYTPPEVQFTGTLEIPTEGEFTGFVRDYFGTASIRGDMNEHELTWRKIYGPDSKPYAFPKPIQYTFHREGLLWVGQYELESYGTRIRNYAQCAISFLGDNYLDITK